MSTSREIYAHYRIMPALQLHQLRVAAVGKLICDNFSFGGGPASGGQKPINTHDVVLACLFHDMGNIIKSDLSQFPNFLEPQGREYWENVKKQFIEKYGSDTHTATVAMAHEIGLPRTVVAYIDGFGFSRLGATRASTSYEQKIAEYSDLRVSPHRICSMEERLAEAHARYLRVYDEVALDNVPHARERIDELLREACLVEQQIFAQTEIAPEDITDGSIAPIIEELWEYRIA
jgi:predicted HD phosphohydrolase